jgi:hypothetical protein
MESISQKPKEDNFEERMKARFAKAMAANGHRVFECVECGERYDYSWIYEYGLRCHVECDHELVEVRK